jgi:DNA-binding LacI/PurR family transcriptional regulator
MQRFVESKASRPSHLTMQDIAIEARVHPSTVSLCLNGSSRISPETRERVCAIARTMGYTPNPYLTALMQSRRKGKQLPVPPALAFVTLFPTEAGWKERLPGLEKTYGAAAAQAQTRGFHLEHFWMPLDQFSPQRAGQILYTRGIRGAILSSFPEPRGTFEWQWENFATVALGPSLHDPRVHRVRTDHFESIEIAFTEARKLRYRRLGLAIHESTLQRTGYSWMGGFAAMHHVGRETGMPDPILLDPCKANFPDWVRRNRLDAVIVADANEAQPWLAASGYVAPRDLGLISLVAPSIGGPISGIYENWEMQGIHATNLVIDLLVTNTLGLCDFPNLSLVRGVWNPGTTLRARS